jgi:hypothetical protein
MRSSFPPPFALAPPEDLDHIRLVSRTRAIALGAGRVPPLVIQSDYEQARLELLREDAAPRPDTLAVRRLPSLLAP